MKYRHNSFAIGRMAALTASLLCAALILEARAQTTQPAATQPAGMPSTQPAAPPIVAVWYQPIRSFPRWKAAGVNTLVGYESEGGTVSVQQYCDAAAAAGLRVVLQWGGGGDVQARAIADPNVIGVINGPDEPDGNGATAPNQMIVQFNAIKQVCPKPVWENFDGRKMQWLPEASYVLYAQSCDVLCMDDYPLNYGDGVAAIPTITARLQELQRVSNGKPVLAFLECSNQNLSIQNWVVGTALAATMRGPTAAEFGTELDAALAAHPAGIGFFPDVIGLGFQSYDGVPNDVNAVLTTRSLALTAAAQGAAVLATTQPATLPRSQSTTQPATVDLSGTQVIVNGQTYYLRKQ